MQNVATSVRIAGDAIGVLSALSDKLQQSKAQVIERALQEMEERIFWSEVAQAYDAVAADAAELARVQAEAEVWERGTAGDYADEAW